MVRSHGENLWVGLTIRETEKNWRFVTDKTFYEQNEANHLFPWATGNNRQTTEKEWITVFDSQLTICSTEFARKYFVACAKFRRQ